MHVPFMHFCMSAIEMHYGPIMSVLPSVRMLSISNHRVDPNQGWKGSSLERQKPAALISSQNISLSARLVQNTARKRISASRCPPPFVCIFAYFHICKYKLIMSPSRLPVCWTIRPSICMSVLVNH